jgi:hypothetical protein
MGMKVWRKLCGAVRALFQKRKLDTEMDEKMRSHIELRAQADIEAGMNPEEARGADLSGSCWLRVFWFLFLEDCSDCCLPFASPM